MNCDDTELMGALECGFPLSFSSFHNGQHVFPQLGDHSDLKDYQDCWAADKNVQGQWAKVCFIKPRIIR